MRKANIPAYMLSIWYKYFEYGWNSTGGNELIGSMNNTYELKYDLGIPEF